MLKTEINLDETFWNDDYNVDTLTSHQALFKHDIYNIEGLVLKT